MYKKAVVYRYCHAISDTLKWQRSFENMILFSAQHIDN